MSQRLRVKAASAYLIERGVQRSQSWLEKARARGVADTRDPGPDFEREQGSGVCWYPVSALDRYVIQVLSARTIRGPAPQQPANFRRTA
jgi:hypothetical protein